MNPQLSEAPLIGVDAIQQRTAELGRRISKDFAGDEIVVVTVLKGALIFASDLIRHITAAQRLEFIRARSYQGRRSSGAVQISVWPECPLRDQNVLVVEDILDTRRTTAAILDRLDAEQPARLEYCALLDKPSRRERPLPPGYVGFTVEDHFVVGYGLDYEERYRELDAVYTLE